MSIDWTQFSYDDLEALWRRRYEPSQPDGKVPHQLNEVEENAVLGRYEDIRNFVETDRIWPPATSVRTRLARAVGRALTPLPDEHFYHLDEHIAIVVEDPKLNALACNAPSPKDADGKRRPIDTIVFFYWAWEIGEDALVGLVAHEFAHSLVSGQDYESDEAAVDNLVESWGFAEEYGQLQLEKKRIRDAR